MGWQDTDPFFRIMQVIVKSFLFLTHISFGLWFYMYFVQLLKQSQAYIEPDGAKKSFFLVIKLNLSQRDQRPQHKQEGVIIIHIHSKEVKLLTDLKGVLVH